MDKENSSLYKTSFSIQRTLAITSRVIRQITRDRRTFAMLLVIPSIVMLIFGLALGGEVNNVPVVIENLDQGYTIGPFSFNVADNLTDALVEDNRVAISFGSYTDNIENVENGKISASILIPENFSESIYRQAILQENVVISITVYLDGTKPMIRSSIMGALRDAIQEIFGDLGITINQTLAFGGAEYSGLEISIPGVMGFVLTFLLILISTLTLVRERLAGTLGRLYATPLLAKERLLGYTIALLFLGITMTTVVLIFGLLVFGAPVKGNVFLLIFGALLYALVHVLISIFLSNFAENELQAVQMAPLIALPSMALSGMMVPVISFPIFVQYLSKIIPLTYGINIFEGIMLKGWGLKQLWVEFLVVGILAITFLILAFITIKDKMED